MKNKIHIITSPNKLNCDKQGRFSIFLAGSIDQGSARDWQSEIIEQLKDFNVIVYNPRRKNWDKTWEQSLNNSLFVEQVTWEQHFLKEADYRIFVMTSDSKSPITLLELGQYIKKPGIILCETGFYRKANVQITSKIENMPIVDTMEELINHLKVIILENQMGNTI